MKNYTSMSLSNNTVNNDILKKYKIEILEAVSNALKGSYGPYGSHTLLYDKNSGHMYTKDGKTILDNLNVNGELANLILNELRSISNHIASTVGDATTSVILLSNILLNKILNDEEISKNSPYTIVRTLETVAKDLSEKILENKKEFDYNRAYEIALIASNGDKEIAERISNLYKKHGNSLVLEPKHSPNNEEEDRIFDGATLDYCLRHSEFVNTADGKCILKSPQIYYFKDPIDTKDMIEAVFTIVNNNILIPIQNRKEVTPTLIIAPKYSRDFDIRFASTLKTFEGILYSGRPPFAIIEANKDYDMLEDVMKLSGGMFIYKTLTSDNADQMKYNDFKFLSDYKGYADDVIIDSSKIIFKGLYSVDKDGNKKDKIEEIVQNINNEIIIESRKNSPNYTYIDSRKKRIRRLKSTICYLHIASIGSSGRNSKFTIYEDVCTSVMNAAENGVGRAALYELLNATNSTVNDITKDKLYLKIVKLIYDSSKELIKTLLESAKIEENKVKTILEELIDKGNPYNIVENDYDAKLLTSIMSDVEILNSLSDILGKLIITNQILLINEPGDIYN